MPDCRLASARESSLFVKPIAWRKLAAGTRKAPALRGTIKYERFVSRQILPSEIPCKAIKSQVGEKVSGNQGQPCKELAREGLCRLQTCV